MAWLGDRLVVVSRSYSSPRPGTASQPVISPTVWPHLNPMLSYIPISHYRIFYSFGISGRADSNGRLGYLYHRWVLARTEGSKWGCGYLRNWSVLVHRSSITCFFSFSIWYLRNSQTKVLCLHVSETNKFPLLRRNSPDKPRPTIANGHQ